MSTLGNEASTQVEEDAKVVYFHSGSGPSYRKVKASGGNSTSFTSIPTIDISSINSPDLAIRKALAGEIYKACAETGFFYASNHGVPMEQQENVFETMKKFFDLPLETKMDAHAHKNAAIRGYEPMLETQLDPRTKGDIKEAYTIGDCPLEPEQSYETKTGQAPPPHLKKPQNVWPSKAPEFRKGMYAYYAAIYPLAMSLVRLFALAFDLPETAFDSDFSFPIWGLRALHYPPMPADSEEHANGLGAHADFSWITLVLQDEVGGLEVLNQDGVWVEAPPKPGTFVVNVGQYLERQTNGRFPATVHRVRNKTGQRRYSIPFFLSQNPEAMVEVLESCVEEGETRPPPTNVGDLYIKRVLPARKKHPTSIKYRDVPESEWRYDFLYAD
ncbi:related to isopenicillin N synthase and related dioxygenases [Ramularia collo-cygni]|uniref:Related to isopenicillin N synthase and related dioxygenases n=1 Tax=Ramularia collo-cygni TaxID=112498 RepID=A0A2D3V107_9PEZI|nr:related to isopenicillin N synthase and related dioxygenases [Ramularia collo-cygni]CZT16154.1 related to isopenicillin N synthase and related dioxygenases [Ramularia collo-cygni]